MNGKISFGLSFSRAVERVAGGEDDVHGCVSEWFFIFWEARRSAAQGGRSAGAVSVREGSICRNAQGRRTAERRYNARFSYLANRYAERGTCQFK